MVGDAFGRFSRDMQAAGRDLEHLEQPARDYSAELAGAVREEAPYVTGYLVSTVYSDATGVGVGAVYAGVVHDSNPYSERALDRVDAGEFFGEYVDDVLDAHLQAVYI